MIRSALKPTEIVTQLSKLDGWRLSGDGADLAIEKTWDFDNYYQTMSFVNAVAHIANQQDHHPDLTVSYKRCVVRFRTHDVNGLSITDFESAARVDALID
jgi:4a-hydroxytetrahydrobiopterin dehydratase